MGFGSQLGRENQPKIDPKGHLENDMEKKPSRKRFGGVLGLQNPSTSAETGWRRLEPAARGRGGGDAGATPRKDS